MGNTLSSCLCTDADRYREKEYNAFCSHGITQRYENANQATYEHGCLHVAHVHRYQKIAKLFDEGFRVMQ